MLSASPSVRDRHAGLAGRRHRDDPSRDQKHQGKHDSSVNKHRRLSMGATPAALIPRAALIRIKASGDAESQAGDYSWEDMEMRLVTSVLILGVMPVAAAAQAPECRTIPRATDRLACYDRATPPVSMHRPAAPNSAMTGSGRAEARPAQQSDAPSADMLAVENGRVNAKTKTICRGC
jgi:hypothetical protein